MSLDADLATLRGDYPGGARWKAADRLEAAVRDKDAEIARLREIYEPASRLSDPTHELTQLEWNAVMSRLRFAVSEYELRALLAEDTP